MLAELSDHQSDLGETSDGSDSDRTWVSEMDSPASDSDESSFEGALPQPGAQKRRRGQKLSDSVVLRLMAPYFGTGRNVTTDWSFISLALAKELLHRKTTIVGAVNKAKRELPPAAQGAQLELHASVILKESDGVTLTVYKCRPKTNVCVLSSRHVSVAIGAGVKRKPETVVFFNSTKSGVCAVERMARQHTVKSGSRRWPVAVFYNMLDLAAINAFVLYTQCTDETISRRDFILKLAAELRERHMSGKTALQLAAASGTAQGALGKRKQCQVARCNRNRTTDVCAKCLRHVCGKCTSKVLKLVTCINYDN
ncbi:hypothetical protein AAFF_G00339630 [Aldrovandia affinis]|uniref:PiggyBac transposable element-derived protein domain-containing protein n=1 Tax=Aldrovandia affinis TaxID=143900 RepID=A0AAD7WPF9_9TELE|nr:hypothetical protein AAFF_G00339630 [Aldrovandia affinis]